tara:strand:- start:33 stop:773 length:741 start_codon:yes stop_codon:yes gene_type:complete
MKLRQFFEAKEKTAVFAFGRLNPATNGHELLVNAIVKQKGDHFLFLSDRPAKLPNDPLSSDEKLDWAQKSFNTVSVGLAKNALIAADRLYKMGYKNLVYLEGDPKMGTVIKKYNGVSASLHNYNFDNIELIKLQRDPDDPGPAGMSATKLRAAAQNNDFEKFKAGVTDPAKPFAQSMFKKLQDVYSINEKSVSKAQQRLFGQVYSYKKGKLKNPSKAVKDIAKGINKKDSKDFAATKHKGLPNKVG